MSEKPDNIVRLVAPGATDADFVLASFRKTVEELNLRSFALVGIGPGQAWIVQFANAEYDLLRMLGALNAAQGSAYQALCMIEEEENADE
jgi:hypothetical protein